MYLLERLFARGPWAQFVVLAVLIAAISLAAGTVAWFIAPADFTFPAAVWWAFLRLTDPGYLGDDEGAGLRALSTFLTVIGYVVFLGAFVAILTQWLQRTLRRLEAGTTPYAGREHICILGMSNRTAVIVEQLMSSPYRVRRFLRHHGAKSLRIVVLADDTAKAAAELRAQVGPVWSPRTIVIRAGSTLRSDHLLRIDPTNASSIILPSADTAGASTDMADTVTVKTLMSLSLAAALDPETPPVVIAELRDARNAEVARAAYRGPLRLIAGDRMMSRILAQSIRYSGMSAVCGELLAHNEGNEIYLHRVLRHEATDLGALCRTILNGIVIGVIRAQAAMDRPLLNPPTSLMLEEGDRLVVLARDPDGVAPRGRMQLPPIERTDRRPAPPQTAPKRILVLGWNRRLPSLIEELAGYDDERYDLTVASRVAADHRERLTAAVGEAPGSPSCRHILVDYGVPGELESLDPLGYDVILMVASDWVETAEHADARSITAALLLQRMVGPRRPPVIMELSRDDNAELLPDDAGEAIVTPRIMSFVLTQVSLRHELGAVYDELFAAGGTEIALVPRSTYAPPDGSQTFAELERTVAASGHTALGFVEAGGGLRLNPPRSAVVPTDAGSVVSIVTHSRQVCGR